MWPRTRVFSVVLAMCLLVTSPAFGWFGGGWLEKLSGPGPFTVRSFEHRFVCVADTPASPTQSNPDNVGWKGTFDTGIPRTKLTVFGCHFLDRDQPRLEFGFRYSRLSSDGANNRLAYPNTPTVAALDKAVNAHSYMLTADVRVNRVLDVGVAAGRATFTSPSGLFADLPKTVFTPIRVTVRPFSPLSETSRWADVFSFRVEATRFNGGFRDVEFGALPDTFTETGELVWGWHGIVDLGALFWLKK